MMNAGQIKICYKIKLKRMIYSGLLLMLLLGLTESVSDTSINQDDKLILNKFQNSKKNRTDLLISKTSLAAELYLNHPKPCLVDESCDEIDSSEAKIESASVKIKQSTSNKNIERLSFDGAWGNLSMQSQPERNNLTTNLTSKNNQDQNSIIRVETRSVEETLQILALLAGRFQVTIEHEIKIDPRNLANHRFEINNRSLVNRRKSFPHSLLDMKKRGPRWLKRGNVCKKEIKRTHGFPEQLLNLVKSDRKCRRFIGRFICVDSYGRGTFAPRKVTTLKCCHGYSLSSNRAICRRIKRRAKILTNRRPSLQFRNLPLMKAQNTMNRITMKVANRYTAVENTYQPARGRSLFVERRNSNYTTFVPNDEIFEEDVGDDAEIVTDIFDNLIIQDKLLLSKDLQNNEIHLAISNNPIRFNFYNNKSLMTANCIEVSSRDSHFENVVHHVIEGLLGHVSNTIYQFLHERPQIFSILTKALDRLGLSEELSSQNKSLTLFAPTNEAFEMLAIKIDEETDQCLKELIENHLVDDVFCSLASREQVLLQTRDKKSLFTNHDGLFSTTFVNETELIKTDVMMQNGVLHLIPNTIYRVKTVGDILDENSNLTAFKEVLKTANVLDRIESSRNITVVAPYNKAFEKLTLIERQNILNDFQLQQKMVSYFVINSNVNLLDIQNSDKNLFKFSSQFNPTYNSHLTQYPIKIKVNIGDQHSHILKPVTSYQCVRLSKTQPKGDSCTGKLITIDQLPPVPFTSLYTVLKESQSNNFSVFLSLLEQAGLKSHLEQKEDQTLFAPTNRVFERFSQAVMNRLFGNLEKSKNFLLFHFIPDFKCFDELIQRSYRHITKIKVPLFTCPKRGRALVGRFRKRMRTRIVTPNILANNGIVHAIDNLLLYRQLSSKPRKHQR